MSGDNPITGFFRSLMLSQMEGMHQKMEDRVAVNSIYAQRLVERLFVTPDLFIGKPSSSYVGEPMTAVAHPDVKMTPGGARSSYDGAIAFASEAKARRDELLAKYAAERS